MPGMVYLSMRYSSGWPQRPLNNTSYCYCFWLPTVTRYKTLLLKTPDRVAGHRKN